MKISLKQSKQMQVTGKQGQPLKLGKKTIKTHEDLVNVLERKINTFNNTIGKNFRKEGFNDVFQNKVEDMKSTFGLNQVNTGLEKGKVKLRQYTSEQLINMYEELQKQTTGNTGTVSKYKKSLNKQHALKETIKEIVGEKQFNSLKQKELFMHNFITRMNDLKHSKDNDYDSEQIMKTVYEEMDDQTKEELARDVFNRAEEIDKYLKSHRVGENRRFRNSRRS